MPSFRLQDKLPSCDVSSGLLRLLQKQLQEKALSIAHGDVSFDSRSNFSIQLVDVFGVETFSSVDEISGDSFIDGISEIRMKLDIHSIQQHCSLSIDISFSTNRQRSMFEIYYDGNDARNVVVGINDQILRIVNTKKNNNYMYNPTIPIQAITLCLAIWPVFVASIFSKNHPKLFVIGILISTFSLLYLNFGKRLRPYNAFDCPSTPRKAQLADWLTYGFVGFILFSTLFALARKILLGF